MRYRIKPIWHVFFALVLALAAASTASAQSKRLLPSKDIRSDVRDVVLQSATPKNGAVDAPDPEFLAQEIAKNMDHLVGGAVRVTITENRYGTKIPVTFEKSGPITEISYMRLNQTTVNMTKGTLVIATSIEHRDWDRDSSEQGRIVAIMFDSAMEKNGPQSHPRRWTAIIEMKDGEIDYVPLEKFSVRPR